MLRLEPVDRTTTVERVVEALRAAMFSGDLVPGTPLREIRLAESLGVARSTVREALQVLTKEGLASRVAHRGVVVAQLTAEDVDEIYRARRILEVAGVRAMTEASATSVDALRGALSAYDVAVESGDQPAAVAAHLRFHTSIVGLLGSSRLVATAEALVSDVRLAMASAARTYNDSVEQVADHRRLLELVEGARVEDAVHDLTRHLARGKASLSHRVHEGTD